MTTLAEALRTWSTQAGDRLGAEALEPSLDHVGIVGHVGDGVAEIRGLSGTRLGELIHLEDGSQALALRIGENEIGCVIMRGGESLCAGMTARGTGAVFRVPVGEALLGRIVDATGAPLDDGPTIEATRLDPAERPAPGIGERDLVEQPLMTGILAIDAMIPLGRGQRELIIGDRKTGKTTVAVDTIINQKSSDVICVYAAIGQKSSAVRRVVDAVTAFGAPARCIFVVATADAAPGAQWIAPFSACTMAEHFRDQGRDVLLVLDDLSKHAIAYRQLSLLLRRPAGREAYPGDVFYLHARLLERASRLSQAQGGGSLTALPIAETQAGNLTGYIPTNLISITDGQIYLEPRLFHEGQRPAVNIGLSVSRVGGRSQAPAMRRLAGRLRLDYAQFVELEVFTRFGAAVEERARQTIEHGKRLRAVLVQAEHQPRRLALQLALLLATAERRLDVLALEQVETFKEALEQRLEADCPDILTRVDEGDSLADEDRTGLLAVIDALVAELRPKSLAEHA